jgi:acetyl-CoA C-acetyltransferase
MANYLNLNLRHIDTDRLGGSSYLVHVATRQKRLRREMQRGADHARRPAQLGRQLGHASARAGHYLPDAPYEMPYSPVTVNLYAMVAMRHMHEYGTTSEQLAWVKVAASHHASTIRTRCCAMWSQSRRS